MRYILISTLFASLFLSVSLGLAGSKYLVYEGDATPVPTPTPLVIIGDTGENLDYPNPHSSPSGRFLPLKLNAFLPIQGNEYARVEELKITPASSSFLGWIDTKAQVNIKNFSLDKKMQISVYLAIYDKNKNLLAAGNYSTFGTLGGYEPRQTSTEDIRLGFVRDLKDARYYQYRVIAFLEK